MDTEKITIDLGNGDSSTFTTEYIICTINASLRDPYKSIIDITLDSSQPNGTVKSVQLTQKIWQEYLLSNDGPYKPRFQQVWTTHQALLSSRAELRQKIQSPNNESFKQNISNFLRDLRSFDQDEGAQNRLLQAQVNLFVGQPYFDTEQSKMILETKTMEGTLKDGLQRILGEKCVQGGIICTGHDIAPVFEAAFGMKWNKSRKKIEWTKSG